MKMKITQLGFTVESAVYELTVNHLQEEDYGTLTWGVRRSDASIRERSSMLSTRRRGDMYDIVKGQMPRFSEWLMEVVSDEAIVADLVRQVNEAIEAKFEAQG